MRIPIDLVLRSRMLLVILLAGSSASSPSLLAQDATPPGYRAFSLQHAKAADIAPQLQEMLDELGTNQEVMAERSTNRLLILGAEQSSRLVDQLLRTLDRPANQPAKAAAAEDPVIARGYSVAANGITAALEKVRRQFPPSTGVRAAADSRTSQILIVASEQTHKKIASLFGPSPTTAVQASVEKSPDTSVTSRDGYRLTNISWQQLEDQLARVWKRQLFRSTSEDGQVAMIHATNENGPYPVFQIDRHKNWVSFVGSAESAEAWRQVVQALDRVRKNSSERTQLVPVDRANPTQVQETVDLLQEASRASGAAAADMVSVILQPQTDGAAEGAADQPTPTEGGQGAGNAAANDQGSEEDDVSLDGGLLGPVQIEYLEGLDVIVLRGHKRDVERVQRIIADIERFSKETQPSIEILELKHVGGEVMADLVSTIYDEILSSRQGAVTIRALGKPNSLLMIGRPESVEVVKDLVVKLDQPVTPESQFEVFNLKHASALDAEETISNFFVDRLTQVQQGGAQGVQQLRQALGARVNVVADYRSNSLIVQASPRDMQEVRRLVARLDVETSAATNELRIFRLKNALATDIAPVLQDALNWQLIGNRAPVGATSSGAFGGGQGFGQTTQERARIRSAILTFMTIDSEGGGKLLESGLLSDIRVTADINGNSLIVTGPAKNMGLIEALVEELDRLPNAQAEIKVFTIVNGDAAALSSMLQQLLGQSTQTQQQGGGTLFGQGTVNPFLSPLLQTSAATGESTLVPVRFGVDQRTNSIIVTGSKGDLGVVEAVLLRLDEQSLRGQQTAVYWLANAPAATVATAVNDWLDQRSQLFDEQLQFAPEAPLTQINREIIVVAEEISNSIIISATPDLIGEIKQVVESLDRRPPLIKIDVLIAEVVLTDFFEFGAEYGIQDGLLFDRTYLGNNQTQTGNMNPGYNFNNQPLGDRGSTAANVLSQGLTSFGMGRVSAEQGYGGMVLSASSNSVSVLLRALQERGRLQILSRPIVATLDSQPALINVGSDVSRFQGTTLSGAGTSQLNVVDVPTGIIVGVTPRVTAEGLVVMEIDVTKSKLSDTEGVELPSGDGGTFFQANIDRINASSTISARNGQTIVFAGLIETLDLDLKKGIPWLSDLPHVGPLFRFTTKEERRSELLMVMTPTIVYSNDESEIDWIKYSESERMSWCLTDVVEVYGDVGFSARPGWWCGDEHGCSHRRCSRHGHQCVTVYPDENPAGIQMIAPLDGSEKPLHVPPVELGPTPVPAPPAPTAVEPPSVHSTMQWSPTVPPGGIQQVARQPAAAPYVANPVYGPAPRGTVAPAVYSATAPPVVAPARYDR